VPVEESAGTERVQNLKTPQIDCFSKRESGRAINTQSCADWALKVEKRNPDVVFDKSLMDVAFRYQAAPIAPGSNKAVKTELDKMMRM
jgi:hypothetical protein